MKKNTYITKSRNIIMINETLNAYFDHMINIFEEDFAVATFVDAGDVIDSLNPYSDSFRDFTDVEIY